MDMATPHRVRDISCAPQPTASSCAPQPTASSCAPHPTASSCAPHPTASSSPLRLHEHHARPEPACDDQHPAASGAQHGHHHHHHQQPSPRTRRLQRRSAGFRAPTLPARQVTPPRVVPSMSTTCSTTSSAVLGTHPGPLSDAENVSPAGSRPAECRSKRQSSATWVLQEMANGTAAATIKPPTRVRPRVAVTSRTFDSPGSSSKHDSAFAHVLDSSSCLSSAAPVPKPVRRTRRPPMSSHRSASAESRRYIDHLETELQSAQAQLQAVASPSVTREHSSTVRHLKADKKQLEQELAEWEANFDERLQDGLRAARATAANLQARLGSLEQDAEERAYRVHELERKLEAANQSRDSIEAANVNLEKRLEIMSELLAASPTKIDLRARVPGRPKQARPRSTIQPRFPTAGCLMSPERPPHTQPSSPSLSSTKFSPANPVSPTNLAYSPDAPSSDEHSKLFEHPGLPSHNTTVTQQHKKPARRMRRFGAGSMGPKPLILPSTSHREQMPASAPALDHDENPFAARHWTSSYSPRSPSSLTHGRRRASSDLDDVRLASPPFPDFPSVLDSDSLPDHMLALMSERQSPHPDAGTSIDDGPYDDDALLDSTLDMYSSGASHATTRNLDSLGSAVGAALGRNLMQELTAVRTASTSFDPRRLSEDDQTVLHSSPSLSGAGDDGPPGPSVSADEGPARAATPRFDSPSASHAGVVSTIRRRASSTSVGVKPSRPPMSTLDTLRRFFGDVFDSPVALAKHLIETVQRRRIWIPRPLLHTQWWLAGVLLGPMAKQRFSAPHHPGCRDSPSELSLLRDSSPAESATAFGSPYRTPPASSRAHSTPRHRSLVAGTGKKRAASPSSDTLAAPCPRCPHHAPRYKHSPWLWLKFSVTLALAVRVAFTDGPGSLLAPAPLLCECPRRDAGNWRRARRDVTRTP